MQQSCFYETLCKCNQFWRFLQKERWHKVEPYAGSYQTQGTGKEGQEAGVRVPAMPWHRPRIPDELEAPLYEEGFE